VLRTGARVPLRDSDATEQQVRPEFRPQRLGARQRGGDGRLPRGRADEDRQTPAVLFGEPPAEVVLVVLADRPVDHGGQIEFAQVPGEVLGWVHRRGERERAFRRVPVTLVIDVVQHQSIGSQALQTFAGDVGDLLRPLRRRRSPRRRHREQQELADAVGDALLQVHGE